MTIDELEKAWNAEPRENAWDELGLDEIVAFAQEVERARVLAAVKAAFWETFHAQGELWFSYLGDEAANHECTESWYDLFYGPLMKNLEK